MRTLFWVALVFMVVALVMIPVTISTGKTILERSRPFVGHVTSVTETFRTKASGAGSDHLYLVWVAFKDPFTGADRELAYSIEYTADAEAPNKYPVGLEVRGFYEESQENVNLTDALPDPYAQVKPLGIAAAIAGALALLLWFLSRR
jgi:hypothetical protein